MGKGTYEYKSLLISDKDNSKKKGIVYMRVGVSGNEKGELDFVYDFHDGLEMKCVPLDNKKGVELFEIEDERKEACKKRDDLLKEIRPEIK